MVKRLYAGALSVLLLTSCVPPGGVTGASDDAKATVTLNLSSLNHLKTVSAYRLQQTESVGVTDFTPESYRVTIASIGLIGSDGRHVEIYKGQEPLELADQQALEAVINASALPVEPGTYVGAQIRFGEVHAIKGSAQLGDKSVYTKATANGDAGVAPAEPTPIKASGDRELDFAKPITVKAGEHVKLSLIYDLTDAVNFYPSIHADGFKYLGGEGIELKYIPFFAFVGEPPKPEIYRVVLEAPDFLVEGNPNWHVRMVLFPKDNGELAGLQCIGRIDPGFTGSHFSAIGFVNNRIDAHSLNADGTYRLVGHREGGALFPMYELKSFQRKTHTGKFLYLDHRQGSEMTTPQELTYHATQLQ